MFNGKSRNADKFVVRLPPGLRERIKDLAAANHRSMNSETVIGLEKMVDDATHIPNSGPLAQSADEIRILEAFRRLSPAKRKSLISLLANDQ